ncbi:IrpT [Bifidobacterium hapali]|uniref:IrpT n=2 Tax=Bifidobacterium hapali TaxID=1630172 RepID=A0A261FZ37_9BIFI|nr:IrpT [Bifidobacterium hapali]
MIHRMLNTIGLGALGIDPITAVYMMSMRLRGERKSLVTLFFLSFAGSTILVGTVLAASMGAAAAGFLQSILPDDDSRFWAIAEFAVSIVILIWVAKRVFAGPGREKKQPRETVRGSALEHVVMGFVFAVTSFTDPTFYAVMLIGGESCSVVTAALLLTLWFVVSQCLTMVVYAAIQCNRLDALAARLDEWKARNLTMFNRVLHGVLIVVAILLTADATAYLSTGGYLL